MLVIPKELSHIWIGPLPAPKQWMDTWKDKHPEWNYTLYDNKFLKEFDFKTHKQLKEYWKRGQFAGVADLMRLEILYEWGGFMPGADSICFENTTELFQDTEICTIYENEFLRGRLVSPIQAAIPKHDFIGEMIERLSKVKISDLDEPWISTGNWFTAEIIDEMKPNIKIFPSHYFIPVHYTGHTYSGNEKIYAQQLFGSTNTLISKPEYPSLNIIEKFQYFLDKRKSKKYNSMQIKKLNARKKYLIDDSFLKEKNININC